MNMAGDIRVKTEQKHRDLYNSIKASAMGDMHELFFLCACLGYKAGQKKRLVSKDDRFWSRTITYEEWACYYAMVLEKNHMDLTAIQDDSQVISAIEQYANAGVEILISDCLAPHVARSSNDIKLDPTSLETLSRELLHFIFEKIQ